MERRNGMSLDDLAPGAPPKASHEKSVRICGTLSAGGGQCPADILLVPTIYHRTNCLGRNPTIEAAKLPHNRILKGKLTSWRKSLDPLPAVEDRGPGKLDKDWLGEVGMPEH